MAVTDSTAPRRLLLHLGAHKTGSSSLQVSLVRNRDLLLRNGIWYPPADNDARVAAGGVDSGNGIRLAWYVVPSLGAHPSDAQQALDDLVDQLRQPSDAETVLLSCEFLYRMDVDRWRGFLEVMRRHHVHVEAVLYLRDIAGHALSLYNQEIKRALVTSSFEDYITPGSTPTYEPRYEPAATELVRSLGAENVQLIHYDSVRGDVEASFYRDVLRLPPGEAVVGGGRTNRSLDQTEVDLMRQLNPHLRDHTAARIVSDALLDLPTAEPASPLAISGKALSVLEERFGDLVERLNTLGVRAGRLSVQGDVAIRDAAEQRSQPLTAREQLLLRTLAAVGNLAAETDHLRA